MVVGVKGRELNEIEDIQHRITLVTVTPNVILTNSQKHTHNGCWCKGKGENFLWKNEINNGGDSKWDFMVFISVETKNAFKISYRY